MALFSNMVRNLSGFVVVSVALLAASFAHQEVQLSRARDAWRMEDNREERRKEVKVETLAVKDQDQQDYTWRKVAQREGILRTTKVDSIGKEAATPRREEDEATRRVDRREREAVSTRREEVDATRRVDTRRREAVSARREEDEATTTRRVDTRRDVVESELSAWTMQGAIQNKKQQPETNSFNEKETDGAVNERSETKLVLKFIEKTKEDLSCWNMFGLKSLKKIIPGTIQEL